MSALAPLRAARADVVYRHLVDHGASGVEGLIEDLVWPGSGHTRAQIERALEDLARAGRVELTGYRGYLDVEVFIDDETEASAA